MPTFVTMLASASCTMCVHALRAQVPTDTLVRADSLPLALPTSAALAQLPLLGGAVKQGDETVPDTLPRLFGVYPNGSISVTVLTPRSIAGIVRDDSLDAQVRVCLPRVSRSYRPRHPWARLDSATSDRAFVLLQVGVSLAPAARCLSGIDPVVRGADIQIVEAHPRGRSIEGVAGAAVLVRGQLLAPALVARARSAALDKTGKPLPVLPQDLRVYLAPDVLSPDSHGRFPNVDLWLTTADVTRGQIELPVSDTAVAQAWSELTPWRFARLEGLPHAVSLPSLRPPSDTTLQRAATMYRGGVLVQSGIVAAHRQEERHRHPLTTSDARFADLLVGSVFAAYGDSAAARGAYANALRSAPCLRFAEHPAFDAQLNALRPANARCQSISPVRQLAAGLVVPGGAQWVRGNRYLAGLAAATTVTLFEIAAHREQDAEQQYDAYRSAVNLPPSTIASMLSTADATRSEARAYVVRAASVWAGSAVVGLVQEAVHSWRVRHEQQYEPAPEGDATR